jgi:tetratricopeptide (TPR) repeat protein
VLLGQVVRGGAGLVFAASLYDVSSGAELARVENVTGTAAGMLPVADRMVAELLARGAGEPAERLPALLAAPLGATRAYLAGRLAFARGSYLDALRSFAAALALDSGLAVAALGLATAGAILGTPDEDHGKAIAHRAQMRLGVGDRAYLAALVGPRYPAESPHARQMLDWEAAAARAPDRPEFWYQLGRQLHEHGGVVGAPEVSNAAPGASLTRQRAAAAFARALELDPGYVPALGYAIEIAAGAGDTVALRDLAGRYFARDSTSHMAEFYRWRTAVAFGDADARAALRARLDQSPMETLDRIIGVAQVDGAGLDDALAAAEAQRQRSVGGDEANWSRLRRRELALNRGRIAATVVTAGERGGLDPGPRVRMNEVIEWLVWDADSAATAGLAALSLRVAAAVTAAPAEPESPLHFDICAAGLWETAHGRHGAATRAAALLRAARAPLDRTSTGYIAVCAAVLDAQVAAARGRPDAGAALERLDSLMRLGPRATTWARVLGNITAARLWETRGDLPRALAAIRRRHYGFVPQRLNVALSTFLREEGRLAALTGDAAGAIRAYRHYLALRDDPDPAQRPWAERIRLELQRLEAAAIRR